ncbi:MAG: T9SS type A sorting domain-containing protein, partial [Ignavibacteria bacterium]|nr:T9SS type A sorting domain-containing protein [Ignavibacteria bacterium]
KQNIGYVDASFVVSGGPYKIGANQNLKVAYVVAAADNLAELRSVIKQSRVQYKTIVSVEKNEEKIPAEFELLQNYPNPFNPETTIGYQLPKAEHVTLKVYDVLGREVVTLVNEFKQAGNYVATLHATSLPSGVYLCRLSVGKFVQTKKMVLLK